MKILNLKYKMHKLVNLVFYVIVFGLGFLLGFLGNKINFNDLLSNFLFIDKVYAEESNLVCSVSENLFDITQVNNEGSNMPATIKIEDNNFTISGSKAWLFSHYVYTFSPGAYYFTLDSIDGPIEAVQIRTYPSLEWYDALYENSPLRKVFEEETTLQFRFYNSMSNSSFSTKYINFQIKKEICVEEEKEVFIDIVNDNFYNFSKKIIGDLGEDNYFVYDFITLGLISVCFIFFVLLIGYIIKKFFGG